MQQNLILMYIVLIQTCILYYKIKLGPKVKVKLLIYLVIILISVVKIYFPHFLRFTEAWMCVCQ